MTAPLDGLLAETIARHFSTARVDGAEIDLGFGSLTMACEVADVQDLGFSRAASLYMRLRGGRLGEAPVFMSVTGYEATPEAATITGACNWACAFGPVLRRAFADEPSPDVDTFPIELFGRTMDVVINGLDSTMSSADTADPAVHGAVIQRARARLGAEPWLIRRLVDADVLPLFDPARPAILSAFAFDHPERRVLEVKVNGTDWPAAHRAFMDTPLATGEICALLRELAIVLPRQDDLTITREALQFTLHGLERDIRETQRAAVTWPGWRAHEGHLEAPLDPAALPAVEAETGPLPPDYRAFVSEVAAAGAGPGYGLIRCTDERARRRANGRFDAQDGARIEAQPPGVLLLAEAGCGVTWLLALRGPHRGEVWASGLGADDQLHFAAPSFAAWYLGWLDAAVRDVAPWVQWDGRGCATATVFTQVLRHIEDEEGLEPEAAIARLPERLGVGAIALASGGGAFHSERTPLDPCESCVRLAEHLEVGDEVFVPAAEARRAAAGATVEVLDAPADPVDGEAEAHPPGFWQRAIRRFRGDE